MFSIVSSDTRTAGNPTIYACADVLLSRPIACSTRSEVCYRFVGVRVISSLVPSLGSALASSLSFARCAGLSVLAPYSSTSLRRAYPLPASLLNCNDPRLRLNTWQWHFSAILKLLCFLVDESHQFGCCSKPLAMRSVFLELPLCGLLNIRLARSKDYQSVRTSNL